MKSLTSNNFGSEGMHTSAGMAAATPALFVPDVMSWKMQNGAGTYIIYLGLSSGILS